MLRFKSQYALPLLILGLGLVGVLLLWVTKPTPPVREQMEKVWPVDAIYLKRGDHAPTLTLHGRIKASSTSLLKSAVTANVRTVLVRTGDSVKKGDLLLQLDDREVALILAQRNAEIEELKSQIESEKVRYQNDINAYKHEKELLQIAKDKITRQIDLQKKRYGSQNDVDTAREAYRSQALQVTERERALNDHIHRLAGIKARLARIRSLQQQAKIDLEHTQIRAPFDGRIVNTPVTVGDRVGPGESLIEIYDISSQEIHAQLPQRYAKKIYEQLKDKVNLTAKANIDGFPVNLVLSRLSGSVIGGQSGVDGIFEIKELPNYFRAGQIVTMRFTLPKLKNTFIVPSTSIYHNDILYIVEDNRLRTVRAEILGLSEDDSGKTWAILNSEELKEGDAVVVTQLPIAGEGMRVTIRKFITDVDPKQ